MRSQIDRASPRTVALASTAGGAGGVWRHIEDLGRALEHEGIEVILGLLPSAVPLHLAAADAGLRWTPLHRTVSRAIDVWHVHLHHTYDAIALAGTAARCTLGPTVITEHLPRTNASDERLAMYFPRTRGARAAKTAFKRVQYALADEVIAVSSASALFLEQRYRLAPGRVTTVHNGVSTAVPADPPRRGDRQLNVLAFGNLAWQKGFDVLLDAARVSREDWKVAIVGDGWQLNALRELARGLAPGRVQFHGWADDPRSHLLASDVVCMPSRWESFPYGALEAATLGRPIVGSRVDGLDEIIEDDVSGLLVAPEDPAELAAALDRLAAQPKLLASFGSAAHERAKRFSLSRMVRATIDVYTRACWSRGSWRANAR